ncbi:unnamed protein product [Schistosoma turkestanicum]|nr:unnamed protein product [Schistosoma turkestanicum]
MTSFNCFKIHDTDNFIIHNTKTNNSEGSICTSSGNVDNTNSRCNQSITSAVNAVISTTTTTTTVGSTNFQDSLLNSRNVNPTIPTSCPSYSRGSNLMRCRPHFRHASLSSSAFGTCMPSNKRDGNCSSNSNKEKTSLTPSTGVQFSRNCFGYYPSRIRKHLESTVTKNDPLLRLVTSTDCYPVQSGPEIIYTTSDSINSGNGLVRSQSDSTCLSLKAITGDENYINIEEDQAQINIGDGSNKRGNYLSDDSAPSSNISSWETNNSASVNGSNSIDKYNLEINKCTPLLPSLLLSLSSTSPTQMNFCKANITENQEKSGVETGEEAKDDSKSQGDNVLASFMRNSTIGSIPGSGFTSELSNYCGASVKSPTPAVYHQQLGAKLKCGTRANNLSTPSTPSRSYQLICRNGIQSYTLVTDKPAEHSISPENLDFAGRNSESSICFHDSQSSNCCSSSNDNSADNRLCDDGRSTFPDHLFIQHQFETKTPGCLTKSYELTNHSGLEIPQSSDDTHIQPILQYYAESQNNSSANLYSINSTSKECSSHPIPLDEISTSNAINTSHSSHCCPVYSDSFEILNNSITHSRTLGLHLEPINLFSQINQSPTGSTAITTTTASNNTTEKPTAPLPSRKQRPLSPSISTISVTGVINPITVTSMHQSHTNISSVDHHQQQQQQQQQAYTPKLLHNNSIAAVNVNMQSRTPSKSQGASHRQKVNPYLNTHKSVSGWSSSSSGGNRSLPTNSNIVSNSHQTANFDQFITETSADGIINYYSNNNNYIHNTGISSNAITNSNTNNNTAFMNSISGDLTAQNSPHRSHRTVGANYSANPNTVESTYNTTEPSAPIGGGLQASISVHCSSNLLKSLLTSIPSTMTTAATIFTGNADSALKNKTFTPSSRINNRSSVSNHQTVATNQKHSSISSHPPPPPLPQSQQEKVADLMIDDPANEMTISELRSIAERQRQQLARQAQQLQAREERRAWLRSLNSQRSAQNRCAENEKVTSKPSDLSQEQEIRLHKLRGFRGQTEQVRLSNENLVKEIDRLASLLSGKEHDLQVCRQRADEAERMLTLINQWHNVIASARRQTINQIGTNPTHLSDENSSSSPLSLPFMQPPFFSDIDKKRWHDGLVEADRLDRQFAAVFGRKPPIQTWSSSQSNLHYVNSLVSEKQLAPHISSSIPSVTVPSAPLPPSYSTYHHTYSKSRLNDQSPNVHDGHSPPPSSTVFPHIPISHSTPVISRTPATTIDNATTPNTAFSSVLTRASSPPTSSRRSCFRTFMQLHPGYSIWSPNTTTNSNNSCINNKDNVLSPAPIHPLPMPRIKAPPRYASRAVINDTYMRRICRDSVEKYKRTASEIYLASVNKLNAKSPSPSLQTATPTMPSSEWSSDSAISENQQQQTCTINSMKMNEQIVKQAESPEKISYSSVIYHPQYRLNKAYEPAVITNENSNKASDQNVRTSIHPSTDLPPSSPSISSSSSSSSLELIGIDMQPDDEHKLSLLSNEFDSPEDDQKQQNSGDVDSGLGGSDHTVKSEHQQSQIKKSTPISQMTTIMTPETTIINTTTAANHTTVSVTSPSIITTAIVQRGEVNKKEISSGIMVYVDEEHGVNGSVNNNSCDYIKRQQVKSILRKSKSFSSPSTTKQSSSLDGLTEPTQSLTSSLGRSNSVRFHPLALLLDAALEGDLELVKKAASEVTDVSESNDEGITALHNAVCAGRVDVAEFLVLTAGADVNAGDTDGWTPLHCAASCGNVPLAKLLVEHGASLHARTLSDQETPLEKCDQGEEEAECEEYLYFQHERLGSAASGRVYALFPRGIEAAGPGSIDAHLESDELPLKPNEILTIVDREPPGEVEWMLAENSEGQRGLVPRSHISCYPLVRIPPSSLPIMERPKTFPMKSTIWDDYNNGDDDDDDDDDSDGDADTSKYDHQHEMEYKLYDENQLLPDRISKMQFVSSADNHLSDNSNNTTTVISSNNNNNPYTQAAIEVEDVTSIKSPSMSLPLSEVKQYIPRPSSVDFTGLKIDDRQSSDEMGGATNDNQNNEQNKTSETCDLATAF